jgi:hypothetical protein
MKSSAEELKPLDTDEQHAHLREQVLAYRDALACAELARKQYIKAELAWKDSLTRCEQIQGMLSKYVSKKRPQVVVTLDGGNVACLVRYVDSAYVAINAHVDWLPVAGYVSGPSIEPKKPRYALAGKLGTWVRHGCKGMRYLAIGSQCSPTYRRIVSAERTSENGYYIDVLLEGSDEGHCHGAGTNVYRRIGDKEDEGEHQGG